MERNNKKRASSRNYLENYNDDYEPIEKRGFFSSVFPTRDDSAKEVIRKIVMIISLLILIGCAVYFLVTYSNQRKNEQDVNEFNKLISDSKELNWNDIKKKYPNVKFPQGMNIKFAELYAVNKDLVGWISIDGMDINLPVVQTTNDQYYLKHTFKRESSVYGSIFASHKNKVGSGDLDRNTVIYGHRMRRDTQMFTNLKEYTSVDAFKKSPIIEFSTLYKDYKFKVYAVFITNGRTSEDNGYVFNYIFPNLKNERAFATFVDQINQRKLYNTGVDIKPTDKLITLSTCTYEFEEARLVVVGRMIRKGESESIDASKVRINSNPRYPQAWYDKKGLNNPYSGYSKWLPET